MTEKELKEEFNVLNSDCSKATKMLVATICAIARVGSEETINQIYDIILSYSKLMISVGANAQRMYEQVIKDCGPDSLKEMLKKAGVELPKDKEE